MAREREIRQRTVGFISFSLLTHLGLIAAAFLVPNVLKEMGPSSAQSETFLVETAVKETPVAMSLGESAQAVPEEAPAEVKVAAAEIKAQTPARVKAETATKKVLALPAKKAPTQKAAQKVETIDQSELAIKNALAQSREESQEDESAPEVAADIEVPEVQEQVEDLNSEANSAAIVADNAQEGAAEGDVNGDSAVESGTTSEDKTQEPKIVIPEPIAEAKPAAKPAGAPTGAAQSLGGSGGQQVAALVRDADSLSEQPGNAKPVYSVDDQKAGRQGTVVFDAMVTKDGSVQGVQLRKSSGHSTLDTSAYEAFRKHRYLPGQEGMVRKTFQFVLNGERVMPGLLRRKR